MPIVSLQRRMMQLGRVRIGEKGPKGEPKRLDTFRFTSASKALLDAVAEKHGGAVTAWEGAPDEGYFQVTTKAAQLDIVLPPVFSDQDGEPTVPYSSWFEQWSAGGCQRRCDGATEMLTGKPCLCASLVAEKGEDARVCQPTTRVSFMLPDLPGLGVWRLDSHGWNSAVELPGTLEVLAMAAAEHKFIPCVLRIEKRTKKHAGQTRRYSVPVIDLPQVTMQQLASGDVPLVLNVPGGRVADRPELPAAPPPPGGDGAKFENDTSASAPDMGEPPPFPTADPPANGAPEYITEAQRRRLFAIAKESGTDTDAVKKALVEVTGQDSTKAIPRELYDAVVVAVQGAAGESPFKAPAPKGKS